MADYLIPDEELAKAKAYLSGGLEPRMDDTRHLASWIGGQEALHDRVFTLDEALVVGRGRADGGRHPAWPASSSATRRCGWPSWRRRGTCGGSTGTSGCRGDPGR